MKKLYAFDLDGSLVENALRRNGKRFVPIPGAIFTEPKPLPNRRETVAKLAAEGAKFAIITNQAGVAFGHRTEDECWARFISGAKAVFGDEQTASVHVCFAHPGATDPAYREGHGRRKPSPQMLEEAMQFHRVSPAETIYVGDLGTDQAAADAAGVDYQDARKFFRRRFA